MKTLIMDIILFGLIIIGLVRGLIRGFWREVGSIIIIIAAFLCTYIFNESVSTILVYHLNMNEFLASVLSYPVTFYTVFGVLYLIYFFIIRLFNMNKPSAITRVLGAIFVGLKYYIVISFLVLPILLFPQFRDMFSESKYLKYNEPVILKITSVIVSQESIFRFKEVIDMLQNQKMDFDNSEFKGLLENDRFKELINDDEIKKQIQNKEYFKIFSNPKIKALLKDKDFLQKLQQIKNIKQNK